MHRLLMAMLACLLLTAPCSASGASVEGPAALTLAQDDQESTTPESPEGMEGSGQAEGENNEEPLPPTDITEPAPTLESLGMDDAPRSAFRAIVTASAYFTDNLFKSDQKKSADFVTMLSPGLVYSNPRNDKDFLGIDTSYTSLGGGSGINTERYEDRRYQIFAFYRGDYEQFASHTELNVADHKAGAYWFHNLTRQVQTEASAIYYASHDIRLEGEEPELGTYTSARVDLKAILYRNKRLSWEAGLTTYSVAFAEEGFKFMDRADSIYSASAIYALSRNFSAFAQYEGASIDYAEEGETDSTEANLFAGFTFGREQKTSGMFKIGSSTREYADTGTSSSALAYSGSLNHRFGPRARVSVNISSDRSESDSEGAEFVITDSIGATLIMHATNRISGRLGLYLTDNALMNAAAEEVRSDSTQKVMASLTYTLSRMFTAEAGFYRTSRASTDSLYDYGSNTVFAKLTARI